MTASTKAGSRVTRTLESIPVRKFIDDYVYRIDLDADYQREKIWSRDAQEKLIDSIYQNIDIPKIYLSRVKGNENFDYECIDGKQRMTTLLNFFKPEATAEYPLTLRVGGERFTYKQLRREHPTLAKKIEDFELTFVVYPELEDDFLRDIFRRLQLGVRLNSGELLNSQMGTIRDFVYKEMGNEAPFLRNTNLSEKRYSRQFTLAQICINSFSRFESGNFIRARYDDLSDFFKDKEELDGADDNLVRIKKVLEAMDENFGREARSISSRAVAVSAYLFAEGLYLDRKSRLIAEFAGFYVRLLEVIKSNLKLLSTFREPTNRSVLEDFQKYVSQASVEPYAIKRRNLFLEKAFDFYLSSGNKRKILGNR